MNVYCSKNIFVYRLSSETFGYTLAHGIASVLLRPETLSLSAKVHLTIKTAEGSEICLFR
jgi:hypothetical protein